MEKLGRNKGGYHGERLDIESVLRDIEAWAPERGWSIDVLPVEEGRRLIALRRIVPGATPALYLSAGIHGDEPAGPLAVRRLLEDDTWPVNADLWVCPCLNPWGFAHNLRHNAQDLDLNRDYRALASPEVRAHVAWLVQQPRFELTLGLHEDWEAHGFYVYELNTPDVARRASRIIDAVAAVCPIDHSEEIDGRPASGGMIHPSIDIEARPQWPEALYLFRHHAKQSLTLEAPSDFPLDGRVRALVTGVSAALA